jgi:hypothetical protein
LSKTRRWKVVLKDCLPRFVFVKHNAQGRIEAAAKAYRVIRSAVRGLPISYCIPLEV